jgi:hypothetical protein
VLIESKQAVRPRIERWSQAAERASALAEPGNLGGSAGAVAPTALQSRALASTRTHRASVPAGYGTGLTADLRAVVVPV